jgi:uncharacterized membrane protein YfcA
MLFLNRLNRLKSGKNKCDKSFGCMIYSAVPCYFLLITDAVDWKLGLLMALGTLFGAWWASRWSVKKGDRVIRIAMLITLFIMSVKLWFF